MGRTLRTAETLYLDPEKLELLKQLAAETRIARSVLLREAVDDLLVKHGKGSKTPKRKS
jgi:predicted transcriptional regulator